MTKTSSQAPAGALPTGLGAFGYSEENVARAERAARVDQYKQTVSKALVSFEVEKKCSVELSPVDNWGDLPLPLQEALRNAVLDITDEPTKIDLDELNEGLRRVFPNLRVTSLVEFMLSAAERHHVAAFAERWTAYRDALEELMSEWDREGNDPFPDSPDRDLTGALTLSQESYLLGELFETVRLTDRDPVTGDRDRRSPQELMADPVEVMAAMKGFKDVLPRAGSHEIQLGEQLNSHTRKRLRFFFDALPY